ncbi:MAG: 6-phosphogluconolactonase, cycloisomerase 2 family [Ramlibacter sp.]|nr:6-phosphogluconolactonase, cycloisomerase 2 family [Ramlibacter sp.]
MGKRIGWLAGLVAGCAAVLAACGGGSAPIVVSPGGVSAPVVPPPSITSFAAAATHLAAAQPTRLTWASTDASSCSIDNGVGTVDCNGSADVVPGTTTTYTLTATNAGGSTTLSVNISAAEPGRFVFTANGTSNVVRNFSINPATGDLTPLGGPPVATATMPFGMAIDPSSSHLYVADLNSNLVSMYAVDRTTGTLTANGTVPTGQGPRLPVIDPAGRYLYLLHQGPGVGNGSLSMYTIGATGQLAANGAPITLGNQPTGIAVDGLGRYVYTVGLGDMATPQPNEVAAHPNGRFLYASNSVAGTVTGFSIGADGRLTSLGAVGGTGTMGTLVVEARGRFLYAADSNNNFLHMYSIDQATGQLTSLGGGLPRFRLTWPRMRRASTSTSPAPARAACRSGASTRAPAC